MARRILAQGELVATDVFGLEHRQVEIPYSVLGPSDRGDGPEIQVSLDLFDVEHGEELRVDLGALEYLVRRAGALSKEWSRDVSSLEHALDEVLARVRQRALNAAYLRDEHGWPEPRTVSDLRADPRVRLRNTIPDRPEDENLELAAALIVLVAAGSAEGPVKDLTTSEERSA